MRRPAHPADRGHARDSHASVAFLGRAMGSPLRLIVVDAAPPAIAWAAAVAEFEAAEAAMTRFREASDLTRLNTHAGDGEVVTVDRRLVAAIVASDRAARVTDHRFDARVVADLERLGDDGVAQIAPHAVGRRGTPDRLVRRLERGGRIAIDAPVDLGGIGKGLALRWSRDALDRLRVPGYLLDAGGDIVARGSPPEGGPWRVAIEDASGGADPVAMIDITDAAVATSSIRRRRWWHDGREVHHLIDPATGEPADGGLAAVTVVDRDPAWSEVWSKALFVAGRAGIGALARSRGLAAWWVALDGTLEMTPAARPMTCWVASEA